MLYYKKVWLSCCIWYIWLLAIQMPLQAQSQLSDTIVVDLYFSAAANAAMEVHIRPPKNLPKHCRFILPNAQSNQAQAVDITHIATNFSPISTNGKVLKYNSSYANSYSIQQADMLSQLQYTVPATTYLQKSLSSSKGKTQLPQLYPKAGFVLDYHAAFGYFEGFEAQPYIVHVHAYKNQASWQLQTNNKHIPIHTLADGQTQRLVVPHYGYLFNSYWLYAPTNQHFFKVGNKNFTISVLATEGATKAVQLHYLIAPQVEKLLQFWGEKLFIPQDYHFIFIITGGQPLSHTFKTFFSGQSVPNSSVYILPSYTYSTKQNQQLQKVILHELIHTFIPQSLPIDSPTPPQLYEGIVEYIRLQIASLAQNDPQAHFFKRMSHYLQMNPDNLKGYDKHLVKAFLLDAEIRRLSEGQHTLMSLLKRYIYQYAHQQNLHFSNTNALATQLAKATHSDLLPFFKKYILGNKSIDFTKQYSAYQLSYKASSIANYYVYGQYQLLPNYKSKKIIVQTAKLPQHIAKANRLLAGDVIVSVNNVAVSHLQLPKIRRQLLSQHLQDSQEQAPVMQVTVKRAGKLTNIQLTAFTKAMLRPAKWQIKNEEAAHFWRLE